MARTVKGPKPGNQREYLPEAFGNREDPDPMVVCIKDPTEGEKRKLTLMQTELGFKDGEILRDSNGVPQVHITLKAMARFQRMAILAHVTKVEGYEVRGVQITDGETLAEHGETEVLADVALEITTGFSLSESEKKTSSGPSASKRATTRQSHGIVKNAQAEDSLQNEIATEPQIQTSCTLRN